MRKEQRTLQLLIPHSFGPNLDLEIDGLLTLLGTFHQVPLSRGAHDTVFQAQKAILSVFTIRVIRRQQPRMTFKELREVDIQLPVFYEFFPFGRTIFRAFSIVIASSIIISFYQKMSEFVYDNLDITILNFLSDYHTYLR